MDKNAPMVPSSLPSIQQLKSRLNRRPQKWRQSKRLGLLSIHTWHSQSTKWPREPSDPRPMPLLDVPQTQEPPYSQHVDFMEVGQRKISNMVGRTSEQECPPGNSWNRQAHGLGIRGVGHG